MNRNKKYSKEKLKMRETSREEKEEFKAQDYFPMTVNYKDIDNIIVESHPEYQGRRVDFVQAFYNPNWISTYEIKEQFWKDPDSYWDTQHILILPTYRSFAETFIETYYPLSVIDYRTAIINAVNNFLKEKEAVIMQEKKTSNESISHITFEKNVNDYAYAKPSVTVAYDYNDERDSDFYQKDVHAAIGDAKKFLRTGRYRCFVDGRETNNPDAFNSEDAFSMEIKLKENRKMRKNRRFSESLDDIDFESLQSFIISAIEEGWSKKDALEAFNNWWDETEDGFGPIDEKKLKNKVLIEDKDEEDEDERDNYYFTFFDAIDNLFPEISQETKNRIYDWLSEEYHAEDFDSLEDLTDYVEDNISDFVDSIDDFKEKIKIQKELGLR